MVRHIQEEQEAVFPLSADIASAHRLVKIRRRDWPLLGCKARSEDKTIWINCVGTFGISSASYWWSRLFSGIGRLAAYIMQQQNWWQLVYVDDLHLTCLGARKFVNMWIILLIYELVGAPFSYKKFSGGQRCQDWGRHSATSAAIISQFSGTVVIRVFVQGETLATNPQVCGGWDGLSGLSKWLSTTMVCFLFDAMFF